MNNDFENKIDLFINKINRTGNGLGWKNHCNRTFDGKYIEGEKFDYIIITGKRIVCFDAKQTISDKWEIKEKDIKQARNLLKAMSNPHVVSFFLIYFFKEKNYVRLNINDFFRILEKRKYIKYQDGISSFILKEYLV
jgi:penicillin-binding protein-related factor A (putative recombinase)